MSLEIDFLRHYGWNRSYVDRIKRAVGPCFLPIQEKAIRSGNLFDGRSLVVAGPTSCGKGLIGELACLSDEYLDMRPPEDGRTVRESVEHVLDCIKNHFANEIEKATPQE